MNIVQRAVRIITSPSTEWLIAGAEPATTGSLLTYAAILSAIAQICALVGSLMVVGLISGSGVPTLGTNATIAMSAVGWVIGLVLLYVMALIAGALAGSFGGHKDTLQALKLLTFASTPVWVFGCLAIIPVLGWIASLAGYVYGIYLIYRGAPYTVGVPAEKAGGYTAVVAILWLILSLVIGGVIAVALMGSMMPQGSMNY